MALALPTPTTATRSPGLSAAARTSAFAALTTAFAIMPLVVLLAKPIAGLVFVRGSEHVNDWGRAMTVTLVLLAPAAYAMFVTTVGELLKTRTPMPVVLGTMRVAAIAMVPYLVLTLSAVAWVSGPRESLLIAGALSIVAAAGATIWAADTYERSA